MDEITPVGQTHMRIEVRKTSKGEYSYDTTASVTHVEPSVVVDQVKILLREADFIARDEVAQRLRLDGRS